MATEKSWRTRLINSEIAVGTRSISLWLTAIPMATNVATVAGEVANRLRFFLNAAMCNKFTPEHPDGPTLRQQNTDMEKMMQDVGLSETEKTLNVGTISRDLGLVL